MADFVENANVKSAIRTLTNPIEDVTTFNNLVQSVITDNPFGCVSYMTAGEDHPACPFVTPKYHYKNTQTLMTSLHTHAIAIASTAATKAHQGQFRKDGKTPYIVHPERVARRVKFFGGSHIGIIAAWLHDVMEDCPGGEAIVRETLGKSGLPQEERDEIFAIVSAVTKNSGIRVKNERQGESLDRICRAPAQAVLVKLCDRMDNLEDGKSRGKEFLSVYLPLTDELIAALEDCAVQNGYRNALEILKAQRRTFSGY